MKKFMTLILALMLALSLSACLPDDYSNVNDTPDENLPAPATKEELYSLYDAVERDMTKAQIDEALGEATPMLDDYGDIKYYNYYNETKSAGVSVIYDYDEIIETKMLFFNTKANLVPFSGRFDETLVPAVKTNMTVEDAIKIMNSTPLELSCTYKTDGPLSMAKIYCWYNEDTTNFMLHTENGTVNNVALYKN